MVLTRVATTHPDRRAIAVIIVEDQHDVRDGLALLVNGAEGFHCADVYGTMEDALAAIGGKPPDVVLTDLGLPGMSGVEGIGLLHARFPELPILALTIYDNDAMVFDALCAGASGYLLKNTPPARLIESLKDVVAGGAPMSPEIARSVVRLFRRFRPARDAAYRLSPQETELLRLLIDGHHKKTAALEMGISLHTVSFHLKNIYGKLQVHSKTEAVAKALRERILP